MHRIAISFFLLAGEAMAHTGHGALEVHTHGWEYALLAAAIAVAAVGWFKSRK